MDWVREEAACSLAAAHATGTISTFPSEVKSLWKEMSYDWIVNSKFFSNVWGFFCLFLWVVLPPASQLPHPVNYWYSPFYLPQRALFYLIFSSPFVLPPPSLTCYSFNGLIYSVWCEEQSQALGWQGLRLRDWASPQGWGQVTRAFPLQHAFAHHPPSVTLFIKPVLSRAASWSVGNCRPSLTCSFSRCELGGTAPSVPLPTSLDSLSASLLWSSPPLPGSWGRCSSHGL